MIVVEFPPPCALMSMNDRGHWRRRAELTKAWRTMTWGHARVLNRREPVPVVITVHLPVKDRRRRDPHNYYPTVKAIVDGIVDSRRIVPDDTPEWVTTTEPRLVVGAKTVRIEVTPR